MAPSANGGNGERDGRGRFAKGNSGGPGNPHAQRIGRLRSALLDAVEPGDFHEIALKLVEMARDGNLRAIQELFNRTLGKPQEADLIDRLEALESLFAEERQGLKSTHSNGRRA